MSKSNLSVFIYEAPVEEKEVSTPREKKLVSKKKEVSKVEKKFLKKKDKARQFNASRKPTSKLMKQVGEDKMTALLDLEVSGVIKDSTVARKIGTSKYENLKVTERGIVRSDREVLAISSKIEEKKKNKKKEERAQKKAAGKTLTETRKKQEIAKVDRQEENPFAIVSVKDVAKEKVPRSRNSQIKKKQEKASAGAIRDMMAHRRQAKKDRRNLRREERKDDLPVVTESFDLVQTVMHSSFFLMDYVKLRKLLLSCELFSGVPLGLFDALLDVFQQVHSLLYLLKTCKDSQGLYSAMYLGLFSGLTSMEKTVISACVSKLIMLKDSYKDVHVETESFDKVLDNLQEFSDFGRQAIDGRVFSALRDLLVNVAALKVLPKPVALSLYTYLGQPEKGTIIELVKAVFDALIKVLKIGDLLAKGVPLSELVLADNPMAANKVRAKELLLFRNKTYSGLHTPGYMDDKTFVTDADKIVAFFDVVLDRMSKMSQGYSEIFSLRMSLFEASNDVKLKSSGQVRTAPIGVVLAGPPGIGKSYLLSWIGKIHCEVKKRQYSDALTFHRVMSSQYWEGYLPYSHPYIHFSEVAGDKPENLKGGGDPIIKELTSLIDTQPFTPDVAFDLKGKVFALPELVLVDTNNPGMNFDALYVNPAAYRRRFLYIEPKVKEQYLNVDGSSGIDYSKTDDESRFMDRWVFEVYYLHPMVNSKGSIRQTLLKGGDKDNIDALGDLLRDLFKQRIKQEEELKYKRCNDDAYYGKKGKKIPMEEKELPSVYSETRDLSPVEVKELEKELDEEFKKASLEKSSSTPLSAKFNDLSAKVSVACGGFYGFTKGLLNASGNLFYNFSVASFFYAMSWDSGDKTSNFQDMFAFTIPRALFGAGVTLLWWPLFPLALAGFINPEFIHHKISEKSTSSMAQHYGVNTKLSFDRLCVYLGLKAPVWDFSIKTSRFRIEHLYTIVAGLAFIVGMTVLVKDVKRSYEENKKEKKKFVSKSVLISGAVEVPNVREVSPEGGVVSTFRNDLEIAKEINSWENRFDCGSQRKRIPLKLTETWNVMQLMPSTYTSSDPKGLSVHISRNVRRVTVCATDRTNETYILGVKGNLALINTHTLGKERKTVVICVPISGVPERDNTKRTLLHPKEVIDLGNDVSLIKLSGMFFKDIMKHFSPEVNSALWSHGMIGESAINITFLPDGVTMKDQVLGTIVAKPSLYYPWNEHAKGNCGLPVIANRDKGCAIVGIHCGGAGEDDAYGTIVTRPMLEEAIVHMDKVLMDIHSQSSDWKYDVEDPGMKSPFRYEELFGIDYYGKLPGPILVNNSSHFEPSIFVKENFLFDIFKSTYDFVPSTLFQPPMMRPVVRNGEYISPVNIGLKKISTQKACLDKKVLRHIVDVLVKRITIGLKKKGIEKLEPMTIEDAINGAYDDTFSRRIAATTAGGFGFSGKKGKYIPIVYEDQTKVVREPVEALKKEILDNIERYAKNEMNHYVYNASLKDEPREISKSMSGNTRIFYGAPLNNLVMSKVFLSPFYTLLIEDADLFCTSIGIDMHRQAHKIYDTLKAFSPNILEGDYRNFDVGMPFDIGLTACTVVEEILEIFGYNEVSMQMVRGLLSDSLFPLVNLNQDLFGCAALQPSGRYATAEDNSLRGLIMLMYFWYTQEELRELDFFSFVKPYTYGDDVLASIKEAVSHLFNNKIYQAFVRKVYLMDFTPTIKGGEHQDFVTVDTMSFLKRNFRSHPSFSRKVAPLDMNSIFKTLAWFAPSKMVNAQMQYSSILSSSMRELFFHSTRFQFDFMREILVQKFCSEFGIVFDGSVLREFPSFVQLEASLKDDLVAESKKSKSICVACLIGGDDHAESCLAPTVRPVQKEICIACISGTNDHMPTCLYRLSRGVRESPQIIGDDSINICKTPNVDHKQKETCLACLLGTEDHSSSCPRRIIVPGGRLFTPSMNAGNPFGTPFSVIGSGREDLKISSLNMETTRASPLMTPAQQCGPTVVIFRRSADYLCILKKQRDEFESELKEAQRELDCLQCPIEGFNALDMQRSEMYITDFNFATKVDKYVHWMSIVTGLRYSIGNLNRQISKINQEKIQSQSLDIFTESHDVSEMKSGPGEHREMKENYMDMSGDVPDEETVGEQSIHSVLSHTSLDLDSFFARPVLISSFTWIVGTPFTASNQIWKSYFNTPAVRAKLRNYAYIEADLNVRIAFSGTPFHFGKFYVGYVPLCDSNDVSRQYATLPANHRQELLKWISQLPGTVCMDPKDNQAVDIHIPYINTKGAIRLFNNSAAVLSAATDFADVAQLGRLFLLSKNTLACESASPTNVSAAIYGWLSNVKLGCPTGTQIEITTESKDKKRKAQKPLPDERVSGPVEKFATKSAEVLGAISVIPEIGFLATASSMVMSGLAGIASWFGWSNPIVNKMPNFVKNEPFPNASNVIGYSMAKKISLDPMQELTVDPRVGAVNHDEMTIGHMCGIESLLDTFNWTTTDTKFVPIWQSAVNPRIAFPNVIAMGSTYVQPTALGFAAAPFYFWRGDIEFRFEIVCSKFHRGKLGVLFEPNIAQAVLIDGSYELNKQYVHVVDIQDTQDFIVKVKWAFPREWAKVNTPALAITSVGSTFSPTGKFEFANGYVSVFPFTQSQSPLSSTISVNVYVRSDNMKFNVIGSNNLPGKMVWTESNDISTDLVDCCDLNPTCSNEVGLAEKFFGELPISFRGLLHRYAQTRALTNVGDAAVLKIYQATIPIIPPLLPSTVTNATTSVNLLSYLRYAFLGMRGGMKKRLRCVGLGSNDFQSQTKVELSEPSSSVTTPVLNTIALSTLPVGLAGSVEFVKSTNAGIDVVLPMYTTNQFLISGNITPYYSSDSNMELTATRDYVISFEATGTQDALELSEETATDDDFCLFRWLAAPYYVV